MTRSLLDPAPPAGWRPRSCAKPAFPWPCWKRGANSTRKRISPSTSGPSICRFAGFGQPGVIAREQRSSITVANEYNRHMYVMDAEHPYTTPPDKPFDWVRSRQVGGRSIVWGRQSYRMSDYDFKAASHDGYGEDWPLGYADLAPYYDKVESFIGVSGSRGESPAAARRKVSSGYESHLRGADPQESGGPVWRSPSHHRPFGDSDPESHGAAQVPLVRPLFARLQHRVVLFQSGFDASRRPKPQVE